MTFTSETRGALESAVAAVNGTSGADHFPLVEALMDYHRQNGTVSSRESVSTELDSVQAILPRLRELLSAERETAVVLANRHLSESGALPQLVRHDSSDWHLHAVDAYATLASRILVETAMAMMDVITTDQLGRLGVCESEGCDGVVLDLSRNRSRRYCSVTCGNRGDVAAYRVRKKSNSISRAPTLANR